MKLRQKLAMVLAAAMAITTTAPVVTNAATWNHTQYIVADQTYSNELLINFNSLLSNTGNASTSAALTIRNGYVIQVSGSDMDFNWNQMWADIQNNNSSSSIYNNNVHPIQIYGVREGMVEGQEVLLYSTNSSHEAVYGGDYASYQTPAYWSTLRNGYDYLVVRGLVDVVESTGLPVDEDLYQHAEVTLVYAGDDDEFEIVIGQSTGSIWQNDQISIPLYYTADSGTPAVTVSTRADILPIDTGSYSPSIYSTVSTDPFYLDMGDMASLSVDGGYINDITLEEVAVESIINSIATTDVTDRYTINGTKYSKYNDYAYDYVELIKFELKTSGLEFRNGVYLEGDYGFTNAMFTNTGDEAGTYVVLSNDDEIRILVRHDAVFGNDGTVGSNGAEIFNRNGQRGDIVIAGIGVVPEGRNDGEDGTVVKIKVTSDFLDTETYSVATLNDFNTVLICDDPVDIVAGKDDAKVTFNINEVVPKAINTGDEITFDLNKGFIGKIQEIYRDEYYSNTLAWGSVTFADAIGDVDNSGRFHMHEGIVVDPLHDTELYSDELRTLAIHDGWDVGLTSFDDLIELPDELVLVGLNIDDDGFIVGFDVMASADFDSVDDPEEMEITINLGGRLGEEGNVYLTAVNRGFDEDLVVKVGEITSPVIAVAEETVILESGMRMQAGGKIVITEEYEAMFQKVGNNKFTIAVESKGVDDGIRIEDATVIIDGFQANYDIEDGAIIIEVIRESDGDLASVTIQDIIFTSTNVTPQGQYDIEIFGDAINDHAVLVYGSDDYLGSNEDFAEGYGGSIGKHRKGSYSDLYRITLEEFIQVGTDVRTNAVETTINWRTGATTVNGEKVDLLVEPFVSSNGRTMVGIRDIATFFNIPASQINFFNQPVDGFIYGQPVSAGTGIVQIINGGTIVTFVNGSNIAIAGSQTLYMDEVMQIVDDRSYAPIRYVGEALGLTVTIDEANTTATFKNTAN